MVGRVTIKRLRAIDKHALPLWIWVLLAVNLIFVSVTFSQDLLDGTRLRYYFGLGTENNLAAWWSSMLLLLLCVLYYDVAHINRAVRLPLQIIAMVFIALSVDEQASLHERVFKGDWKMIVIVGLGCVSLFGYAVSQLVKNRAWRRSAIILIGGFACFSTVVLQEFLEHRIVLPDWASGPRTALEESIELLGIFFCLISVLRMRSPLVKDWDSTKLLSEQPPQNLFPIALLGLALHLVAAIVVQFLSDLSVSGNPAAWFQIACYFLCALELTRRMVQSRRWSGLEFVGIIILLGLSAMHCLFILENRPASLYLFMASLGVLTTAIVCRSKEHSPQQTWLQFLPLAVGIGWYFASGNQVVLITTSGLAAFVSLLTAYHLTPFRTSQL